MNNILLILSGPSCAGKSPLYNALSKFYPEIKNIFIPLVLLNSRDPRPGEIDGIDYHFRKRNTIEKLKKNPETNIVLDARGDLQAINIEELCNTLENNNVFFEGNTFAGKILQTHPRLANVNKIGIFMSPVSKNEILFFKNQVSNISLPDLITDIMRKKLLKRTKKQKSILSLKDLENIEKRASSAYHELTMAHNFDYVIPNHDGEDSDNWDAFYYPIGDARKSLLTLVDIIEKRNPGLVEKWEKELIQ